MKKAPKMLMAALGHHSSVCREYESELRQNTDEQKSEIVTETEPH